MATLEDEIKVLKEKNSQLVQTLQYWKMTAADRENEKLNLMKEVNELRLKLSRLKNTGAFEACKLNAALQLASGNAINHLVSATNEIAKSMEIAKAYMRDIQESDAQSPRWSTLSGTPCSARKEKVHRVPPMVGGQSIQPVVALSRTLLNTSNPRSERQSPNQAVPLHMLQDLYIPLTRIDIADLPVNNMGMDADESNVDDSTENLGLENDEEMDESVHRPDDDAPLTNNRLDVLGEEEDEIEEPPSVTLHIDNPLEGPSWLLDSPRDVRPSTSKGSANLEPDSTTEVEKSVNSPRQKNEHTAQKSSVGGVSVRVSCEFSPTVRRRKRTSSPTQYYSPRPPSTNKTNTNGRVLKVLVAKMRLSSDEDSPLPDLLALDAPSPNGATDSAVIVSETPTHFLNDNEMTTDPCTSNVTKRESHDMQRARLNSQDRRPSRDITECHIPINTQETMKHTENSEDAKPKQDINEHNGVIDEERPDSWLNKEINERLIHTQENDRHVVKSHENLTNHEIGECSRAVDSLAKVRHRLKSRRERQNRSRSRTVSRESDSIQHNRMDSQENRDSDSSGGAGDSNGQGRTRRPRKMITYKEKPLNRKLRR